MNAGGWLFVVTSLALVIGVTVRAWWTLLHPLGRKRDD